MKRLTTDTPDGNFETMLNFVYGKDGWAYIRDGGDGCEVPLTQWAKIECLRHGCDEFSAQSPQDIDMEVGGCIMDFPNCPVALAYTFACQATHLRSRLKMYEDILFDTDGKELITLDQLKELKALAPGNPLTLEELRGMDGEPVWVCDWDGSYGTWALVDEEHEVCRRAKGGFAMFDVYNKVWLAYRRKPEKEEKYGP